MSICKPCAEAADAEDVSQEDRDEQHAQCLDCPCQHKSQGCWNGGTE